MRTKILSIRISAIEKNQLRREAKKFGLTISDLVRRILWPLMVGLPKVDLGAEVRAEKKEGA